MSVKINNTEGLSPQQIRELVNEGAQFVMYKYCISFIVMTLNRNSEIYFIRPNSSSTAAGLHFLLISLFLGWWGIPWGPIYTIGGIYNVLSGGTDVTYEVMSQINQHDPSYGTNTGYNIPGQNVTNDAEIPIYNIPS
jgi:hypothetical protein